jgi:choline dehydrogenase-like flavoprotein
MPEAYTLIVAGTGFASSFFLHRFLERSGPTARVLVLERGALRPHAWQQAYGTQLTEEAAASIRNLTPTKPWVFKLAVGGGSNCWWACTPRFMPEDFRMRSTYGVGADWPVTYDEIEPHYAAAETLMAVAGPDDGSPYPRSGPYPQPPHRFSDPDTYFKRRFPDRFFSQPAARPTRALPSGRPQCCNSGICYQCPINSKFSVLNGLPRLYEDPRVTLLTDATVTAVDVAGSRAAGVHYRQAGAEHTVRGDLVALGANAIFNAHILLRSALSGGNPGRGLCEQRSVPVDVDLDGVENFQGSTSITGLGYMLYSGDHRRTQAAALMETWNVPRLRDERGKWRQRLRLKFIFEDLPQPENRVTFDPGDPDRPQVSFTKRSAYMERAVDALESNLPGILDAIPYERFDVKLPASTEAHVLGTHRMGTDPASSVVDGALLHHQVRNLLVMGGGAFPTTSPANPSLTICALSLRAADRVFGR